MIYRFHGRPRWLHLGDARSIGLADARRLTARVMLDVIKGKDPAAERKPSASPAASPSWRASMSSCTPRSTTRAGSRPRRWCAGICSALGQAEGEAITRADVRAVMLRIEAPIVANQVLAAASAIFSWAIKQEILAFNPCKLVERNPTRARARALRCRGRAAVGEARPGAAVILLTGSGRAKSPPCSASTSPTAGGSCRANH